MSSRNGSYILQLVSKNALLFNNNEPSSKLTPVWRPLIQKVKKSKHQHFELPSHQPSIIDLVPSPSHRLNSRFLFYFINCSYIVLYEHCPLLPSSSTLLEPALVLVHI
ncbi:hypothetical protein VTL71DRAFT_5335 [Oculimacula yallundae]|uniref:Uncharacterized protein n=1 Tax=Oculimacula yallundae TaxID=86028 RepID=A0ABR4C0Y3_9HELO